MKLFAALAALLLSPVAHSADAPYGIMLMAHGGDAAWNGEIERLRGLVDGKIPTESALGMADPATLQGAVDRLEKRGVSRVVAVPLFVHSRSEVLDQTRYALGLREKPSEVLRVAYARIAAEHAARASAHSGHGHHGAHAGHGDHAAHGAAPAGHGHSMEFSLEKVRSKAPISVSRALDDHALVARILAERAKALSRNPARERVVLVAHGPVDDAAVAAWNESLSSLCRTLKEFKGCDYGLLRDDATPQIRAAAVRALRAKVARAEGDALVLPVLIARGGIERKIPKDLDGLKYRWNGETLMPHEGFDAWVLERAAEAATGTQGAFDRPTR